MIERWDFLMRMGGFVLRTFPLRVLLKAWSAMKRYRAATQAAEGLSELPDHYRKDIGLPPKVTGLKTFDPDWWR